MGVGHQQRLSRGRGRALKAEIRTRGCGPAPFPKVFAGKSRHLCLLRQKSGAKTPGQRELSLQMPGCSPRALPGLTSLQRMPSGVQDGTVSLIRDAGAEQSQRRHRHPLKQPPSSLLSKVVCLQPLGLHPLVVQLETALLSIAPERICTTLLLSLGRCNLGAKQYSFFIPSAAAREAMVRAEQTRSGRSLADAR